MDILSLLLVTEPLWMADSKGQTAADLALTSKKANCLEMLLTQAKDSRNCDVQESFVVFAHDAPTKAISLGDAASLKCLLKVYDYDENSILGFLSKSGNLPEMTIILQQHLIDKLLTQKAGERKPGAVVHDELVATNESLQDQVALLSVENTILKQKQGALSEMFKRFVVEGSALMGIDLEDSSGSLLVSRGGAGTAGIPFPDDSKLERDHKDDSSLSPVRSGVRGEELLPLGQLRFGFKYVQPSCTVLTDLDKTDVSPKLFVLLGCSHRSWTGPNEFLNHGQMVADLFESRETEEDAMSAALALLWMLGEICLYRGNSLRTLWGKFDEELKHVSRNNGETMAPYFRNMLQLASREIRGYRERERIRQVSVPGSLEEQVSSYMGTAQALERTFREVLGYVDGTCIVNVKSKSSIWEKISRKYDGDASAVLDYLRGTISIRISTDAQPDSIWQMTLEAQTRIQEYSRKVHSCKLRLVRSKVILDEKKIRWDASDFDEFRLEWICLRSSNSLRVRRR
eukprot:TRINITY_DN3578_c0_g1_i1.p1 TRINITY_DN3578_c0_g1~~TRINITY_DN3578_c0_g1_i1.p1  ORF type:complete len:577 (+),score=116.76 TRINITY_DN3578_c0_g1_i1:188-1732(+)